MRKTKIICTMGPAVEVGNVMERLVQEGMNVARFNFSHGDHDEHRGRLQKLRVLRERYGKPVASLLDTKGPEIRICDFENDKIELQAGQKFILTADDCMGNEERVSITYKNLVKDVTPEMISSMDTETTDKVKRINLLFDMIKDAQKKLLVKL